MRVEYLMSDIRVHNDIMTILKCYHSRGRGSSRSNWQVISWSVIQLIDILCELSFVRYISLTYHSSSVQASILNPHSSSSKRFFGESLYNF